MSIKGKNFTVVRDGERTVLTKEVDGEKIAVPSIEVVLVKANKGTSKVFYMKGYQEGSEATKPDCFSNTGDRPDPSVAEPQAKSCALCPHNQWGSKIGDNGGKGKACQDSVRMAIATADLINDPYLLRVPPASIKSLGEYGKMLAKRGVGYNMVVTRIGFDMESPTPKLTFKPTGLLSDAGYAQVQEVAVSDVVQSILGSDGIAAAAAACSCGAAPLVPLEGAKCLAAATSPSGVGTYGGLNSSRSMPPVRRASNAPTRSVSTTCASVRTAATRAASCDDAPLPLLRAAPTSHASQQRHAG
jgi:hypothetical protein